MNPEDVEQLAVDIVGHRTAARHEAAHAACALVQGLRVTYVSAPFRSAGSKVSPGVTCVAAPYDDPDTRWMTAIATLVAAYDGGNREGKAIGEFADPTFGLRAGPPFPTPIDGDESIVLDLVGRLHRDEWKALVMDTHWVTSRARYRRLRDRIERELISRDRLSETELLAIKRECDNAPNEQANAKARQHVNHVLNRWSSVDQDSRAHWYEAEHRLPEVAVFPC